jgi:hypothetical protein
MLRLFKVAGAIVALGAASVFAALPASAQLTPDEVGAVMEDQGYEVEYTTMGDDGAPAISSFTGDLKFLITFEACDENGDECELIVFRCGFAMDEDDQPTLEDLNVWNNENWGKATQDDVNDPWIVLEVNTVGGLSEDNVVDTLLWWENLTADFAAFIGYEP